jgi:hypothetical protein
MKAITSTSPSLSNAANLPANDASQRAGGVAAPDAFMGKLLLRKAQLTAEQMTAGKAADFFASQVRFAMSEGGAPMLSSTLAQLRALPGLDAAPILEAGASAYVNRIDRKPGDQSEQWDKELRKTWLAQCSSLLAEGRLSRGHYWLVTRVLESAV